MEHSILKSTKKILGIAPDYTAFDQDILSHINLALGVLRQVGVDVPTDFEVEDETVEWSALTLGEEEHLVRTYVHLRARMLFDPPGTSFHLEAMNRQKDEMEYRIREIVELAV